MRMLLNNDRGMESFAKPWSAGQLPPMELELFADYVKLYYVPRIKSQMIEQCLSITISNISAKHI